MNAYSPSRALMLESARDTEFRTLALAYGDAVRSAALAKIKPRPWAEQLAAYRASCDAAEDEANPCFECGEEPGFCGCDARYEMNRERGL